MTHFKVTYPHLRGGGNGIYLCLAPDATAAYDSARFYLCRPALKIVQIEAEYLPGIWTRL